MYLEEFKKLIDKDGLQKTLDTASIGMLRGGYNELSKVKPEYLGNPKGALEDHFSITVIKGASVGKTELSIDPLKTVSKTP